MYNQTTAQKQAEQTLVKQGFQFSNWISAHTGNDDEGCMVFTKHPGKGETHYREIDPEGNIN